MNNEDIIDGLMDEVKTAFKGAAGSHDWSHTERVLNLSLHIADKEGGDIFILKAASLLHDIGRSSEDRAQGAKCHAEEGARYTAERLSKYGIEKKTVSAIIHCIRSHRFRGETAPESLEAKILFDADKLDSIGAVGIGRAFLFAGEVGATLHDPAVDINATRPYSVDDTAYREFLVKLRTVKDRMLTGEGKRMARARHEFMEMFFKRITEETRGLK